MSIKSISDQLMCSLDIKQWHLGIMKVYDLISLWFIFCFPVAGASQVSDKHDEPDTPDTVGIENIWRYLDLNLFCEAVIQTESGSGKAEGRVTTRYSIIVLWWNVKKTIVRKWKIDYKVGQRIIIFRYLQVYVYNLYWPGRGNHNCNWL